MMSRGKKKAYLALLVVGAGAMMVDRLTRSTAGPASAEGALVSGLADSAGTVGAAPAEARYVPELRFPSVPPYDSTAAQRDPFRPPMRMLAVAVEQSGAEGDTPLPGDTSDSYVPGFAHRHRLTAVLVRHGAPVAIVDGAWVRVGEWLDGCQATAVRGAEATFACPEGEVVLRIGNRLLDAAAPTDVADPG